MTKSLFYDKPSYGTIKRCIESMACHAKSHSVSHISMPKIGCGLDKLDWNVVKKMLVDTFADANITIHVYIID